MIKYLKKQFQKSINIFRILIRVLFISNQEKTEHVRGMIFSFINFFVSLILAGSIIVFLFYLNFEIAIIISLSAVFSYLLVFFKFKEKLNFISREGSNYFK